LIGTILRDKNNKPISPPSFYNPPQEVKDLTLKVREDYTVGVGIQNKSFKEFNDMSLIQRMNEDQSIFNSYTQPISQNPDDQWRWNGVSPVGHNKIISMAAQYINPTLYPKTFAQNDKDEEDRVAAEVMDTLMRFNIDNSDYRMSYLYAIIAALVNPVAYLHIDFIECYQTIKEKLENGDIKETEVLDEVYSGFQTYNVPADEILIANAYQFHLQKQRFIIRRRFIDFDEAKGVYGKHTNWQYILPGVKVLYEDGTGMFYEQKDDSLGTLCEETIYCNRKEDIEVPFINGVYLGKQSIKSNLIRHRNNKNMPKYPYAKFGFHPIDEKRFFFYRSAVFNMANDYNLDTKMRQMVMDGTFLRLFPPLFGVGTGKVDSNVIFPGSFTATSPNASVTPLQFGDLNSAYNALIKIEQSLDESSQSKTMEGQITQEKKTAYEVARAETNARIQLSIFGIMIAQFIDDVGDLMADDIIKHQTVPVMEELLGGEIKEKYRTYLVPNQMEEGRTIAKQVKFKPEMMGKMMTEKQRKKEGYRLLKEEGGLEAEKKIYEVNPDYFQGLKFKTQIDPAELTPKNDALDKAVKLEAYQLMMANPYTDKKAVTRDYLIEPLAKGESDKYMLSNEDIAKQEQAMLQGQGQPPETPVANKLSKRNSLQELIRTQ